MRAASPVRDLVFEREWCKKMRAFHGALYAPGNYPWGATALVLINVLVFLVFFINTKGWFGVQPQLLTVWGSNYGPLTVSGQWWRLLSSLFLHLSPVHLALNMWVLWNVGRLGERLFGHSVFLLLYFFTGIMAGLATVVWDPCFECRRVVGRDLRAAGRRTGKRHPTKPPNADEIREVPLAQPLAVHIVQP